MRKEYKGRTFTGNLCVCVVQNEPLKYGGLSVDIINESF